MQNEETAAAETEAKENRNRTPTGAKENRNRAAAAEIKLAKNRCGGWMFSRYEGRLSSSRTAAEILL